MIREFLYIGSGSFLGGISRYVLSHWIKSATQTEFPLATFMVNISGCLLSGLILGLIQKLHIQNQTLINFLIIGFCGGFTTFSAFIAENMELIFKKTYYIFGLYTFLSISFGFLFFFVGIKIIQWLF